MSFENRKSTGGAGTVTDLSVVSANGLAGTVANSTTTPAITLSTSITGVLKGDGTSISAAIADTDYQSALTFGIANTNAVKIDSASATNGEYAKLTASGIESKTFAEVKTDLSLNNVENTALSDGTATLTNKTFDANGTGNSLSNVDVADLATGTDGELITWDSSGNPDTVAVGTATHVLTSNGVGVAPTFQAAGGGGGVSNIFSARKTGADQSLTNSEVVVIFGTEDLDTGSDYNNSTGIYTCPNTGNYYFNVCVQIINANAADDIKLLLYKNTSTAIYEHRIRYPGTVQTYAFAKIVGASANDTFEVKILNGTAARGDLDTNGDSAYFEGCQLS